MKAEKEIQKIIENKENEKLEYLLTENPLIAEYYIESGISLLQYAAYCRNEVAIKMLKKGKYKLDVFETICVNDIESLKTLMGSNGSLINSFSKDGFTPLGLACFFGHYTIARYLIDNGADVNIASRNSYKVTPLHSACASSNYRIAELLLENGAKVNVEQIQGVTPLHSAAHNGNVPLAELLISFGANVNARMASGQRALEMAEEKNFHEMIALIKAQSAS